MSEIGNLINDISSMYREKDTGPFPYESIREIQADFCDGFQKHAPDEILTADLNNYWMFIAGLASGGVRSILPDALERYKVKELLEKSFFDWFTKYRFLEAYDLTGYPDFYYSFSLYDELRRMLLEVIKVYELAIVKLS